MLANQQHPPPRKFTATAELYECKDYVCHFCGNFLSPSTKTRTCVNEYCNKTSDVPSILCESCLDKQDKYFVGLGAVPDNVLGTAKDWHCLDCVVHDFEPVKVGMCCCSFRRHNFKCGLHPDQPVTSTMHCVAYRRKVSRGLQKISCVSSLWLRIV